MVPRELEDWAARTQGPRQNNLNEFSFCNLEYSPITPVCKTREGASHPDRNARFEQINTLVQQFHKRRQPAISVDAKKVESRWIRKELVGDFKNAGHEWHPKGEPEAVRVHDFVDPALGKAIPYGVYDILHN